MLVSWGCNGMKISHCGNSDQIYHSYRYTVVFLKCLQYVEKKLIH